ncbi:anhydro-N-acetylmuramic acid kinase [Permianibacter sp. IMCC34836]|uniref:anhydro-N-acetylmuramic acid kinase n=1 Tax=Permianibacter fluminis TaxID=2738515 RepID=UPI0015516E03|nr:anhydro-N-acetylmuramic acid kinase [Permianibacter fluminis]NQD39111.1 anhydro-N-acetylmuramic acid kinase [Permianibacter fluminis]
MAEYYVGALSGTSMDGIDVALVRFSPQPEMVETHFQAFPTELRKQLFALTEPGDNEIDRMGAMDVQLGQLFAKAVRDLLAKANVESVEVRAIGSHGQTIRHRPNSDPRFTLQIGDPNVIAVETGIRVVADFRRKDVALGGQGAPLVPAFHDSVFRSRQADRVICNIGGISNVTVLPRGQFSPILGFDTGPGNTLLDGWCQRMLGEPMDKDGMLAARGRIQPALLQTMLEDPFFAQRPPKSTGPEYFSMEWLMRQLADFGRPGVADVQATLLALTVHTIADAVKALPMMKNPEIYVCGGGAHNIAIMRALQVQLPTSKVGKTDELGIAADWVEAMAFAWLARQRIQEQPGNLPIVTGASRPAVLGSIYLPG